MRLHCYAVTVSYRREVSQSKVFSVDVEHVRIRTWQVAVAPVSVAKTVFDIVSISNELEFHQKQTLKYAIQAGEYLNYI